MQWCWYLVMICIPSRNFEQHALQIQIRVQLFQYNDQIKRCKHFLRQFKVTPSKSDVTIMGHCVEIMGTTISVFLRYPLPPYISINAQKLTDVVIINALPNATVVMERQPPISSWRVALM
mmetsp:Transcript_16468/g.47295  ORF Transcript_16468/g.47295 Transcript_16468/m.47295 type:complete len:120 (-) Transcript_16468:138-497(-)